MVWYVISVLHLVKSHEQAIIKQSSLAGYLSPTPGWKEEGLLLIKNMGLCQSRVWRDGQ